MLSAHQEGILVVDVKMAEISQDQRCERRCQRRLQLMEQAHQGAWRRTRLTGVPNEMQLLKLAQHIKALTGLLQRTALTTRVDMLLGRKLWGRLSIPPSLGHIASGRISSMLHRPPEDESLMTRGSRGARPHKRSPRSFCSFDSSNICLKGLDGPLCSLQCPDSTWAMVLRYRTP